MKTISIAIAAVSAIIAPAVMAAPASTTKQSEASAATSSPSTGADGRKYCVTDALTGSRVPRKQCQTRAEWARDGVDIETFAK